MSGPLAAQTGSPSARRVRFPEQERIAMPFLRLALQTVDPPALPCVWSCSECQAEFALWNESIESVSKELIDQINFQFAIHCRQVHPGLFPVDGLDDST